MDYNALDRFLGRVGLLGSRKLKSLVATSAHRGIAGSIEISYHNTYVVQILDGGLRYRLFSGGWRTATTKSRIKQFSPARLFQKQGVWYLQTSSGAVEFREGVVIDSNGDPVEDQNNG
jgi:hypothetical protein